LYENQRRLQKINEGLEEKLLHVAEKFENEKSDLTRDVSDLTSRLVEARLTIAELEEENVSVFVGNYTQLTFLKSPHSIF
ncbi:hypothetical protein AVEN_35879-1, partial [Araneus ventricosus]